MPLAVLFLQLDAVAKAYLDNKRKVRRIKRQKTSDNEVDASLDVNEDFDLKSLLENKENNLEVAVNINSNQLIDLLKQNLKEFAHEGRTLEEDEVEGSIDKLCLTKSVINAFCQSNVIDVVKQNLFERLN